jgi:hypothetical protein
MLETPGKVGRYNDWLRQVEIWGSQHGITREQAMSIISESVCLKNRVTMNELYSWAEVDDFIFKWKEQHDD